MNVIPPGSLVFGIQLKIQALSPIFAEPWEQEADVDALVAIARRADELGFFYVGVCDHVGIPAGPMAEAISTTWYDTVATLGLVAGVTERIRLLSNVYVLGYRHPLQTAKSFATLDRLSKGRAILGVGAGHLREEFEGLGAPFDGRGPRVDEAIDCVRAAFTDEFPRFSGQYFSTAELGISPRPVQAELPIWVGGSSPAALRRVAERGDGWLPQGTPKDEMAPKIAYIRQHQARIGREVPLDLGFLGAPVYVGDAAWDGDDRPTVSGPPAVVADYFEQLRSLGVNHLQIHFRSRCLEEELEQMDRWSKEVAPRLGT